MRFGEIDNLTTSARTVSRSIVSVLWPAGLFLAVMWIDNGQKIYGYHIIIAVGLLGFSVVFQVWLMKWFKRRKKRSDR